MFKINGLTFYDIPLTCGSCPSWTGRGTDVPSLPSHTCSTAPCILFDLTKHRYDQTPKRCEKLFEKAMAINEKTGIEEFVITIKD